MFCVEVVWGSKSSLGCPGAVSNDLVFEDAELRHDIKYCHWQRVSQMVSIQLHQVNSSVTGSYMKRDYCFLCMQECARGLVRLQFCNARQTSAVFCFSGHLSFTFGLNKAFSGWSLCHALVHRNKYYSVHGMEEFQHLQMNEHCQRWASGSDFGWCGF